MWLFLIYVVVILVASYFKGLFLILLLGYLFKSFGFDFSINLNFFNVLIIGLLAYVLLRNPREDFKLVKERLSKYFE